MTFNNRFQIRAARWGITICSVVSLALFASTSIGQEVRDETSLVEQLRELQSKVSQLEDTINESQQTSDSSSQDKMKGEAMKGGTTPPMKNRMQGMMGGPMMKGTKRDSMTSKGSEAGMGMESMGPMEIMSRKGMQSMGGTKTMGSNGMSMMGQMKGMGKMQMPSALPGFAGASHIYHVGATSFFLDHSQHITLTQEQQVKLNQIKEKALLGQATSDRWIAEAEQELWLLTSEDTPDAAKIEAKIREVEKLNGDKRIAYIRAVGEAARVLTDEQRQTLVGYLPADHNATGAGNRN